MTLDIYDQGRSQVYIVGVQLPTTAVAREVRWGARVAGVQGQNPGGGPGGEASGEILHILIILDHREQYKNPIFIDVLWCPEFWPI